MGLRGAVSEAGGESEFKGLGRGMHLNTKGWASVCSFHHYLHRDREERTDVGNSFDKFFSERINSMFLLMGMTRRPRNLMMQEGGGIFAG